MRKRIRELIVKIGLGIGFVAAAVLLFIIIKSIFFV